ncbi:MAG: type II toxin-antitoxin system HicA family toxin [Thermomicrobiales bacterium]
MPQISGIELRRALERLGWEVERATGHFQMSHPARLGVVVAIPMHRSDVKQGTLRAILRSTGVSEADLKEVL